MSEAKAVFLSYAREDSTRARKIADTLRAAGIEVWFDQSELRGGDEAQAFAVEDAEQDFEHVF